MRYGSETRATFDGAGNAVVTETKYRGAKTFTVTTYKESVMIDDEPQLLAEILKHLEFCKQRGRNDPSFECVTDRDSGQIRRLVKSWSEAA